MLDALKIRYWFYTTTSCLKDTRRGTHPHINRRTTHSNDDQRSPLCVHSSFPRFPPSFCLSPLIFTSHLWAARTDSSTTKHTSLSVGTSWRTSWKADGSPVVSGQPPDGKHTDLQKSVHAVSQLQPARRPSWCLILIPDSLHTFILYFFPAQNTYFITFLCFPPLKSISAASSLQQSGFLPNVQGSLGQFLQFITSIDPTGKLLDTSIPLYVHELAAPQVSIWGTF